jgi:hypothetical protein
MRILLSTGCSGIKQEKISFDAFAGMGKASHEGLRTVCFSKHAHHIFYLQCLTTYRRADRDSRKLQFTVNKTGGNLPGVPFVGTNGPASYQPWS